MVLYKQPLYLTDSSGMMRVEISVIQFLIKHHIINLTAAPRRVIVILVDITKYTFGASQRSKHESWVIKMWTMYIVFIPLAHIGGQREASQKKGLDLKKNRLSGYV